jgi:hypothetical protein
MSMGDSMFELEGEWHSRSLALHLQECHEACGAELNGVADVQQCTGGHERTRWCKKDNGEWFWMSELE